MTKKKNIDGILDAIDKYIPGDKDEVLPPDEIPYISIAPKTYEEISSVISIEIPFNTMRPVNQRIFAIEVEGSEQRTERGIIIPTKFSLPASKDGRSRNLKRYFVVDVADDCTLTIKVNNGKIRLRRGMEIMPFLPSEAEEWTFPEVYDWGNGKKYITFHQTEIHGISMSLPEEE